MKHEGISVGFRIVRSILVYALFIAMILIWALPVTWVTTSLKHRAEIFTIPFTPTVMHFTNALKANDTLPTIMNSLLVAVGAIIVTLLFAVPQVIDSRGPDPRLKLITDERDERKERNMARRKQLIPAILVLLFLLSSPSLGSSAGAEVDYPKKAVNIVVPFPPGQTPDLIARALSEGSKGSFPQPFVVINRPGGAGTLGIAEVVTARPDGYTMGLSPVAPLTVQPQFSDLPYKRPDDYRPVMKTGVVPMVFSVLADSPWKSLKDVIDYAKANPGKMRVGSSGLGSIPHMNLEMFKEKTGVSLTHVPFPGSAAYIPALLGGHIEAISDSLPPVLDQVRAGKVRVLGTFEEKRNSLLPDVPTFRELGFDISMGVFHSVFVPKNTPDAVVRILGETLKKAMDTEPFKKFVQSSNYVVDYQDGATLKKQLEAHYDLMGTMIKKLNLKK